MQRLETKINGLIQRMDQREKQRLRAESGEKCEKLQALKEPQALITEFPICFQPN